MMSLVISGPLISLYENLVKKAGFAKCDAGAQNPSFVAS